MKLPEFKHFAAFFAAIKPADQPMAEFLRSGNATAFGWRLVGCKNDSGFWGRETSNRRTDLGNVWYFENEQ